MRIKKRKNSYNELEEMIIYRLMQKDIAADKKNIKEGDIVKGETYLDEIEQAGKMDEEIAYKKISRDVLMLGIMLKNQKKEIAGIRKEHDNFKKYLTQILKKSNGLAEEVKKQKKEISILEDKINEQKSRFNKKIKKAKKKNGELQRDINIIKNTIDRTNFVLGTKGFFDDINELEKKVSKICFKKNH